MTPPVYPSPQVHCSPRLQFFNSLTFTLSVSAVKAPLLGSALAFTQRLEKNMMLGKTLIRALTCLVPLALTLPAYAAVPLQGTWTLTA